MTMASLCDYSEAYILVRGTVSVTGANQAAQQIHVAFKNCAPFTDCISEINNTQVDKARDLDIIMPMYNLLEYSENYLKTSGSLYQFARDTGGNRSPGVALGKAGADLTNTGFASKDLGRTVSPAAIADGPGVLRDV